MKLPFLHLISNKKALSIRNILTCLLTSFALCSVSALADFKLRDNFGKKSQFDTSSSTSYQSTWGWAGWNPNSSSSSSSSSSSGGSSFWGSSYQAPPPPDDGGLQGEKDAAKASAKEARKYYKQGNWRLAREHAMKWGRNTKLGNVNQSYLYTAATENLWLQLAREEGRDGLTYDKLTELIRQYEATLSWDPNHRQTQNRLRALKAILDEMNQIYDANKAYNEGNAHVRAERWDEALAAYKRSAELNSNDPNVYGQIGWLLERYMDYQEAREAYLEAITKGSQNPKIFKLLANMHHYFKDYELSIEVAQQGLELDSDSAALHNQMAESLEKLYRPAEAYAYNKRALELNPDHPWYISNMIDEELTFKNIDAAQTLIDRLKVVDLNGSNTSHHEDQLERYREQVHIDTPGALDTDIVNAREAQKLNPDDALGYLAEAKALNDMGRAEEADRVYKRALEIEPENIEALTGLFKNTQSRGDLVRTVQDALKVVEVDPDNFEAAYAYQHIMTWQKDEYDARLAENNKRREDLLESISNRYDEKDFEQALIETEEILSFDPENESVHGMKKILLDKIAMQRLEDAAGDVQHIIDPADEPSQQSSAWQQAENVLEYSQKAVEADSLEEAKVESGIGFDTPSNSSDERVAIKSKKNLVKKVKTLWNNVTEREARRKSQERQTRQTKVRDALTDQRLALESKVKQLYEEEQRYGRSESGGMEISSLKQEISDLKNKENYQTFLIEEEIRKDALRGAKKAQAEARPGVDDAVDVSEMSIGGEALNKEDEAKSDAAMEQIRQLAMDDLRQKVLDQYHQNVDEVKLRQKIDDWMESDPDAKAAVMNSRRLMQEATEQYELRPENSAEPESDDQILFEGMQISGALPWPGPQSSDAPLENPVALEEERRSAILNIYKDLKQSEQMMQTYDRIAEELKEAQKE